MNKNLPYAIYAQFADGNVKKVSGDAKSPELLYNDFDGLMPWNEYDELSTKNLTTQQILKMAFELYSKKQKGLVKLSIINCLTNEIVANYLPNVGK
jgi:hypothetical protein